MIAPQVSENVVQSSAVATEVARDVGEVLQAANDILEGGNQIDTCALELSRFSESLKAMVERFKLVSDCKA